MVSALRPGVLTACLALLLGTLPAAGCKEGDVLSLDSVGPRANFLADPPTTTTRYVSLRKNKTRGSRVFVDVVVTDVSEPVSAITMKLTYPNSFAKFIACSDGDLFPSGGTCFFSELGSSGVVLLGRSITAPGQETAVTGSRTAVRLEFLVFDHNEDRLTIEAQNLGGSDASALLDANGNPIFVAWYAGTLEGI